MPHERFFSSLVFATVAHSALISLALPSAFRFVMMMKADGKHFHTASQVGVVVAVALPVVSMWANLLGGLFPMVAVRLGCVASPERAEKKSRSRQTALFQN